MKKLLSIILAALMAVSLFAGCGTTAADDAAEAETEAVAETVAPTEEPEVTEEPEAEETAEPVTVRVGGLTGPTSMGMVKLMSDSDNGETLNDYEFTLQSEATAFVAALAKGEIDIAAVPSNVASVVYNNTEGGVQILAANTLGVLYIVERGDSVKELADLKGKTIYATGEGATPEYALRYLLTQNGIDPDSDITVQWCSDTTEALSYITQDENAIAMLPQPFVTVAQTKVEGLNVAISLNDEWNKLNNGCQLITGTVVVRTEFAEAHPDQVEAFLQEYEASVNYVLENTEEAAELIGNYEIVAAAVAQKALPYCNITFMSGAEMKAAVSGYLQTLYDQNPAAVGGAMPGDDFYYGA
jgi:NitT/TauT family transport system substrate-binding protein